MTEIKKVIDSVICFLGWFLWFLTPSLCFYFCTQHPECNNTLSWRIFRLYDEVKIKNLWAACTDPTAVITKEARNDHVA